MELTALITMRSASPVVRLAGAAVDVGVKVRVVVVIDVLISVTVVVVVQAVKITVAKITDMSKTRFMLFFPLALYQI